MAASIEGIDDDHLFYFNIIKECAENKEKRLNWTIEGSKICVNGSSKSKRSSRHDLATNNNDLCDLIKKDQLKIMTAFKEAYTNDVDCESFQSNVNKLFESRGQEENCPNFMQLFTAKWMSFLSDAAKSKPFNMLMLPGTHNSFANNILWSHRPMPINKGQYVCCRMPVVSKIVKDWTLNQRDSVVEQFKNGVRLFDIRISKDSSNKFYVAHTFLLCTLKDCLEQIKECLDTYTTEVIVINIKIDHPCKKHFTKDDVKSVFEEIDQAIGSYILPMGVPLQSLNGLIEMKKRLIVYCNLDHEHNVPHPLIRLHRSHEIWPNEASCDKMLTKLKRELEISSHRNEFTYLSFNTTVDAKGVVKGILTLSNNIKQSHSTQKSLDEFLHEQKHLPSGIIIDTPTKHSIQQIIIRNFYTGDSIKTT